MKIFITSCVAVMCLFLISCSQKSNIKNLNERAKDSVTAFLKTNLNDPSSYQPIGFDSLKRNMTEPPDTITLGSRALMSTSENYEMLNKYELYKKRESEGYYKTQQERFKDSIRTIVKNFKPKLIGYLIDHHYRAKNAMGGIMLYNTTFELDTTLKVLGKK
jgi:hypothetical protein